MSITLYQTYTKIFTSMIGLIIYYYFGGKYLQRKKQENLFKLLFNISIIIFFIFVNAILTKLFFIVLSSIVLYSCMVILFYEGNIVFRMIAGLFFVFFGIVIEAITALFLSAINSISMANNLENANLYIAGAFISKLIMIIIIKIILWFTNRSNPNIPMKYWGLMLIIPAASIYVTTCIAYQSVIVQNGYIYSIGSLSCILVINLIAFGLFDTIIKKVEENRDYRFANQQLLNQQDHYAKLISGQKATRGLWHDMKNFLIAVHTYIESCEYDEVKFAIERMNENLQNANKDIITGNLVIDAIINSKNIDAGKYGIKLVVEAAVQEKLLIDPIDLCIIIGNAIDNAIEACLRIEDPIQEKYIDISIYNKNNTVLILISNPINTKTIKMENGTFLSSKDKKEAKFHGFGMYNMMKAVKNHAGNLVTDINDNKFILKVIIPINNDIS